MHCRRPGTKKAVVLRGEARQTQEYVFSQSVADFLEPPVDAPVNTRVERPTADGRRVHAEVVPIDPPSPVKKQRREESNSHADPQNPVIWEPLGFEPEGFNGERYNMELGGFYPLAESAPSRRRRAADPFKPSDKSLFEYRPLRDEYLAELLRRDGCGNASDTSCPGCDTGVPTVRCRDCFGGELYCTECSVRRHENVPLHIVDLWDGTFFKRSSLKELGLRIQFGHAGCVRPQRGHEDFVVLDLGYIHRVAVDFCGCTRRSEMGDHRIQLLRRGWFPAMHDMPKTAATFRILDFFHMQTLQGKTTMFDFYTSLEKLTNASGTSDAPPPKRYREFLRMTHAYRNLLMLKRAGRGHELGGVNATQPGELAIQCPACPRPGGEFARGMGERPLRSRGKARRFLYILFMALDACFRLKRRLVSSDLRDPGLGTGWAYFVENEPYRQYLLTVTDQNEATALDYANTKFSRGYSATGVGMGVCARHEFVQPNGVGDLQKGERTNTPGLRKSFHTTSLASGGRSWSHASSSFPAKMRLAIVLKLLHFAIPKMHIHSHTLACQLAFSLNYLLGAGQTDGEGIERPWANIGGVASSTREMGPGSRRDVLDDHWGFWNWTKLTTIGALLRRRLDNAKQELEAQTGAFEMFSAEQADRVPEWEAMAQAFDADPKTAKNPYEIKARHITEAEVKLKFAEEEQASAARGVPSLHDVQPEQFHICRFGPGGAAAPRAGACRAEESGKLQATYTPGALQALARIAPNPDELPEDTPLMLPSALSPAEHESGCVAGVHLIEVLARDAQCSEALVRLRNQLHVKSRLLRYKEIQARHQGANTRSRTLVARNESKIRLHSERYQAAWDALRRLRPEGETGWRQLRREDVRTMEDAEELSKRQAQRKKRDARRREKLKRLRQEGQQVEDDGDGEGTDGEGMGADNDDDDGERVVNAAENKRQVSWIWTTAGSTGSDAELEDTLRIEWTKARARCKWWAEEVALLEEEYRRVLNQRSGREARARQGRLRAQKQADLYRKLATKVTVAATEIHQGRGRKRIQVQNPHEPEPGEDGERIGEEAQKQRAEQLEAEESDSDAEEDDEQRGDVHSDEEFFMGGEAEDD
ncbi:CxC2 domain-containing protein [Mycena sanguinolenta]|uniref:CxC2 domain-containing protein n=1 Tax=Mycena sanguinolenta TaxID=230812 RepID=A0A8H7D1P8_9AGAR|nr:CxC2 domain-containing protein [Mycena sanguinolenta]